MAESRYIDRAELFNRLSSAHEKAEVFAIIQSMPGVNIERDERKGNWIPWMHNNDKFTYGGQIIIYKCSECNTSAGHKTNFCPECGAMMKGEKEQNG